MTTFRPAVLMHAIGNAVATALLADGVLELASTSPILFFPSVEGVVMILLTAVVALLLVKARDAGARVEASEAVPSHREVGIDEPAMKRIGVEMTQAQENV